MLFCEICKRKYGALSQENVHEYCNPLNLSVFVDEHNSSTGYKYYRHKSIANTHPKSQKMNQHRW